MEDFGCLWTFQENVDDLKQKLQYVTYELEITRKQTNEEILKSNQHIKKLLVMLQNVCKERDEAKSQFNKLQQILSFNNKTPNFDQFLPTLTFPTTPFSPDSPLLSNFHVLPNSVITESNNFSIETNSNNTNSFSQPIPHSRVSSPAIDSLSYNTPTTISSPDSNNNCYVNTSCSDTVKAVDGATVLIEKLAKGRPRPKQGELLQAVINAGPLLQTLMVAGSLPRWRNPPGLITRQIPPVQIKGSIGSCSGLGNSAFYGEINGGGAMGVCPSSMLEFGGASSRGSCLVGGRIMPSALSFDCPTPKRQRLL